jgi:T-complex protein 1 subunit gamma
VLDIVSRISIPIDTSDDAQILALIERSIRNQFIIRWADLMCCSRPSVVSADDTGARTIDIKRSVRVEKALGGETNDSPT